MKKVLICSILFRTDRLGSLSHLCEDLLQYIGFTRYLISKETDQFVFSSTLRTIQEIAPQLNETIFTCDWPYNIDTRSKKRDKQFRSCNSFDMFTPMLTEEGLCFAFNELNSNEIYTEE